MDKAAPSSLFVNDGSFMERFKLLQQEKGKDKEKEKAKGGALEDSKPKIISGTSTPKPFVSKTTVEFKVNDTRKTTPVSSSGKLAFSLKQKSKLVVPPVKLGIDEEEDEMDSNNVSSDAPAKRQKLGLEDASEQSPKQADVAYTLSTNQDWWKEMFNERFGICGRPATRVICIPLFMLSVLISFISDMQHHLPQVIL